jgi:membrane-bound lytic murein transglycosylase B
MRIFPAMAGLALLLAQQVAPVVPVVPVVPGAPVAPLPQPSFEEWLNGVRAEALTRGIGAATLDRALTGLEPVETVIQRDRTQAEIVQTLDQYLSQRVSKRVVQTAQTMRQSHRVLLKAVGEKFGVPPGILVSIWGLESNFGRFSGVRPSIATLATLAYDPRRSAMFRQELFDALTILDSGDVEPAAMRGSWAGALGQPQFMPSSFLLYAQDFDQDGKRDIWKSTPDVFASIANYLSAHGWSRDQTWGREVQVPAAVLEALAQTAPMQTDGCLARRQMTVPLPLAEWKKLGLKTAAGGALPSAELEASLVSGAKRHFLVYPNYQALLAYNCVNAYGLSVGLLADRASDSNAKDSKVAKTTRRISKTKK